MWSEGVKDTIVNFIPSTNGRFLVSWVPPAELQNRVIIKNGVKHPGNEHCGAFGCDSYDISGTVDNRGSKGACLLYTSPSPRDRTRSRMPSSA